MGRMILGRIIWLYTKKPSDARERAKGFLCGFGADLEIQFPHPVSMDVTVLNNRNFAGTGGEMQRCRRFAHLRGKPNA
jgi:hypothetical protein